MVSVMYTYFYHNLPIKFRFLNGTLIVVKIISKVITITHVINFVLTFLCCLYIVFNGPLLYNIL